MGDSTATRFLKFNGVGAIGFALQLGVLAGLMAFGLHYLAATAIAVELTILHNFAWHERWTWRDRPGDTRVRARRLWRFHAANGLVSLAGNLVLMRVLVGAFGMPPIPANLLSVLACGLVNFAASDRIVFRVT
jgi:putative flippase GtrA